jgi:hypothetical protein
MCGVDVVGSILGSLKSGWGFVLGYLMVLIGYVAHGGRFGCATKYMGNAAHMSWVRSKKERKVMLRPCTTARVLRWVETDNYLSRV